MGMKSRLLDTPARQSTVMGTAHGCTRRQTGARASVRVRILRKRARPHLARVPWGCIHTKRMLPPVALPSFPDPLLAPPCSHAVGIVVSVGAPYGTHEGWASCKTAAAAGQSPTAQARLPRAPAKRSMSQRCQQRRWQLRPQRKWCSQASLGEMASFCLLQQRHALRHIGHDRVDVAAWQAHRRAAKACPGFVAALLFRLRPMSV